MAEPDFRALTEDLSLALHNAIRIIDHKDGTDHIDTARVVLDRARAALAQPPPEPPTGWKEAAPDFRALCAELIGWGERTADHYYTLPEVLIRARTALEQTEPKPQDDPTPNRPPLWQAMSNVYPGTTSTNVSKLYAAELRAIAEAVQTQFAKHFADGDAVLLEVIDWLDDEADRAEAGHE